MRTASVSNDYLLLLSKAMELFPRNIPDAQARIWVHHNSDDLQRRLNRAIHPARNVKSNSSLEGLLLEIGNLFDRPMLVDQLGGQKPRAVNEFVELLHLRRRLTSLQILEKYGRDLVDLPTYLTMILNYGADMFSTPTFTLWRDGSEIWMAFSKGRGDLNITGESPGDDKIGWETEYRVALKATPFA